MKWLKKLIGGLKKARRRKKLAKALDKLVKFQQKTNAAKKAVKKLKEVAIR